MREILLDTGRGAIAGLRHGPDGGRPLLALHGWLDNAASFVPLLPELSHLDIVAIDLPGHGRSPHRPPGADYAFADWILDVLAVLDALEWSRPSLLGHSLGGAVGLLLAAAEPGRVERLALIESIGPLAATPGQAATRLRDAIAARRPREPRALRRFPDVAAAVQARVLGGGISRSAAGLLVERGLTAVDGGFVWSSDRRLTLPTPFRADEETVGEWLEAVRCPVQVVAAETPPAYFPIALRERRLARLADVRCKVLPGSHHLHMDRPGEVAAVLRPFLDAAGA